MIPLTAVAPTFAFLLTLYFFFANLRTFYKLPALILHAKAISNNISVIKPCETSVIEDVPWVNSIEENLFCNGFISTAIVIYELSQWMEVCERTLCLD